ncbi:ATP-dependent RNA helicase DDX3X [Paragonimus westermani]|uniref:RNA helicase n=1 Tax=Paragonimus westermani TaxID=34504 RepID=A0A5J4P2P8_9TREM|nr:ATP-dependent RNA helicase DDX3X [Paragonimus westermani]
MPMLRKASDFFFKTECCRLRPYDLEPVDEGGRKVLREPPGFVSSHRWMIKRPADENLEAVIFGKTEKTNATSSAQEKFLASEVKAQISGIPVTSDFSYVCAETISDVPHIDHRLLENLTRMGLGQLTPVQRHAIGIMSVDDTVEVEDKSTRFQRVVGKYDIMAAAQTGSGKTLAYLIPIVNRLLRIYPYEAMQTQLERVPCQFPSGLILAPTRELVQQIRSEAMKLCYRTFLRPVSVYGGERPPRQLHQLTLGCHLIVATPGRLLDFLRQGVLQLTHCRALVLDEADRMLDMGFEEQIREILELPEYKMPQPRDTERQTCLYSATFPHEVALLARNFLRGSRCVSLTVGDQDSGTLVPEWGKTESEENQQKVDAVDSTITPVRILVFCNTKREVDEVDAALYRSGLKSVSLHGDKSQVHRSKALDLFRKGVSQVLVASSVAARGLDIPNVTAVVNVGFPVEVDDYVHRIGRTGRMGRSGKAVTLVNRAVLAKSSRSVVHGILSIVNSSAGNVEHIPEPVIRFAGWSSSGPVPRDLDSSTKSFVKTSKKPPFSSASYSGRRQSFYKKQYTADSEDLDQRFR